jgi:hypothetical protein
MTATTPTTYTGEDADIYLSGLSNTTIGMGSFSLSIDRGTIEQELVGEAGNYFTQGAMTVGGSLTNCLWGGTVVDATLGSLINGTQVAISGNCGANSLHFYLVSCQVTGFDITIGDAGTVTEGSLDFTMTDPYNLTRTDTTGEFGGSRIANG